MRSLGALLGMATTEKWVAGTSIAAFTSYAAAFGAEINSLANLNSVLSSILIDNSASPGDVFGQVSISLGSVVAPNSTGLFIGFGVYPLNQDTSTYGDGQFGSAAAAPIPGTYQCGAIPVVPNQTAIITGTTAPFPLYLGKQKLVLYNGAGVALASSSNTIKFLSLNRGLV